MALLRGTQTGREFAVPPSKDVRRSTGVFVERPMTSEKENQSPGVVKAIAWRSTDSDPMRETRECRVRVNTGIDTENRKPGKRSVTFLAVERWKDACRDLGAEVHWHARRANFLLEGVELAATIGRTITIGQVSVLIHGETKPCPIMDQQHQGLRDALKEDFRGGVFGQVLTEGTICVGDPVVFATS